MLALLSDISHVEEFVVIKLTCIHMEGSVDGRDGGAGDLPGHSDQQQTAGCQHYSSGPALVLASPHRT